MTQETKNKYLFEIDGIEYRHPDLFLSTFGSVYPRPMIQLRTDDCAPMMVVNNNYPKSGLMDSKIDEKWLDEYWDG